MNEIKEIDFKGDYIGGQFIRAQTPDGEIEKWSPGDIKDHIIGLEYSYDHVIAACSEAKKASSIWSKKSKEDRFSYIYRFKALLSDYSSILAQTISRETGKPLWETTQELQSCPERIDRLLNSIYKQVEMRVPEGFSGDQKGSITYHPRGVMAIICSFNSPVRLGSYSLLTALATGNSVVYKPSEHTPLVGQILAEMFQKIELPVGVFNMVQGEGEVGRKLALNEDVDGVLFFGSYEVGYRIKQETVSHHWKHLGLQMGGKNSVLIHKDADIDKAVYETVVGAYLSSGQRCTSTSRVFVADEIADKFIDSFYKASKRIKIGHWSEDVFMGPLISADAVEKYIRFQEIAKREGCESLMRGKALSLNTKGHYVTPSINLVEKFNKKSVYQTSEIFAPNVAVYRFKNWDDVVSSVNDTGYGLTVSIFSKNQAELERAIQDLKVGWVNFNRRTTQTTERLPFGGVGKSGNFQPSGLFTVFICSYPKSIYQEDTALDHENVLPGIDWQN